MCFFLFVRQVQQRELLRMDSYLFLSSYKINTSLFLLYFIVLSRTIQVGIEETHFDKLFDTHQKFKKKLGKLGSCVLCPLCIKGKRKTDQVKLYTNVTSLSKELCF